MIIRTATSQQEWDAFLIAQEYSPFLQSWTMGEVYRECGEPPLRLEMWEGNELVGICQAIVVAAKRGKHLAVLYGPILKNQKPDARSDALTVLCNDLKNRAKEQGCSFIRMSPFWPQHLRSTPLSIPRTIPAPLHLLAEHIWYIDLRTKTEEEILQGMRKNHRNLIRRAEREGVEVSASTEPLKDIAAFFRLYDETRKRHHFVPYPKHFIQAQVQHFCEHKECTLYLARYGGEVIASSVHMHCGGETSYHHGASTHKYPKIPASYLLQWTAITDALRRGDRLYNFWGIAPEGIQKHPFRGVTTFKTGFGGELMELIHCFDIPLKPAYYATHVFERWRKWKRGF